MGKTFFWATMLGVVGERFPEDVVVTMGTVGGIGMLSAGLLGGPGIGYVQDKYASEKLKQESVSIYDQYAAKDESHFLLFKPIKGLDGKKVGELMERVAAKQKLTSAEEADAKPVEAARPLRRPDGTPQDGPCAGGHGATAIWCCSSTSASRAATAPRFCTAHTA